MPTHDKSPSAMNARALKSKSKKFRNNLCKHTTQSLFDAIFRPVWDGFSQADAQAIFKILTGYFSESRLYQHTVASFLRYHSAHDPALSQAEHAALESELLAARQAQAEAEFRLEALEKRIKRQCEIWRLILDADPRSDLQPLERLEVLRVWQEASLMILAGGGL